MNMSVTNPTQVSARRQKQRGRCVRAFQGRSLVVALVIGLGTIGFIAYALLAPAAEADVWACGESLKVPPQMSAPAANNVWNAQDGQIQIFSAKQEYAAFQVVVRAGSEPLKSITIRPTPLRKEGAPELNLDLFRQHYLPVNVQSQYDTNVPVPDTHPGEQPTQMVPLPLDGPGSTFDLSAGRNQPIWVDVYVPEQQASGVYTGEIVVLSEGKPLKRLQVRLTVWRFALPRETHLKTMVPTGVEQLRWAFNLAPDDATAYRALEDQFFQMAHQHRINFQPSEEDDLVAEWGGPYRKYLNGSAYRDRAGQGVGNNLLFTGVGGETQEEVTRAIRKVSAWWKSQPDAITKRTTLACYVYDEPQDDEDFAAVEARGKWIRSAVGNELPLFLTTSKPHRVSPGLIDAWGELPAAEVPKRQALGERAWATNQGYAAGPYVDSAGYAGRTQGWMAWKMGLEAWHFWDGCYWVDRQNLYGPTGKRLTYREVNASPRKFITDTWTNALTFDQKRNPRQKDWIRLNGDGVLFYPGTPAGLQQPLASFTLKSLRRGLQDYEYLWLLKQAGQSADDVVERLVPRPNEWQRNPEAWDDARIQLGKRLDALSR